MKKNSIIFVGAIVIIILAVILINNNNNSIQVGGISDESQEPEVEEKETEMTDQDKDESFKVISNTDRLNRMPQYEEEGKVCKEIAESLERGDCFQKLHDNYLLLSGRTAKNNFYFPYVRGGVWNHILHVPIDENDQLGEMQKEDYFDQYEDKLSTTGNKYQRGLDRIRDFWYVFSALIPRENREELKQLYWTDSGEAYVFALGRLEYNVDEYYMVIPQNFMRYEGVEKFTMLHEYAHMLTMNLNEVDDMEELPDGATENEVWEKGTGHCSTYNTRNRCVKEDSYLYKFYEQFWKDYEDEWMKIDWNSETAYKDFFHKYEERFFNSYQGTSPVEDIADSLAFFFITNSADVEKSPEMKYKKLQFFYQFEEFVELRTAILENLYDLSVKDREFY
ncbi:hypothetical protein [Bacillus sp. S/N-304-OC-R1]|uniref:hypothetical protein n=1 Tax=Bacillus sp. S/N-304-OC-R1 TaxID=2758034 RepID=UPI001C8CF473|nr:hypothetical protein [Bacillus sp. S/N-304-OC-R1]MBY0123321.1 hypothetical protein [Bacillus sp. S/N-304-OC-R1]